MTPFERLSKIRSVRAIVVESTIIFLAFPNDRMPKFVPVNVNLYC